MVVAKGQEIKKTAKPRKCRLCGEPKNQCGCVDKGGRPKGSSKSKKSQVKAPPKPRGRPPVLDDVKLGLLQKGFILGFSDEEACQFAGISHQTLYNYQKENPDYVERKKGMKLSQRMQAKINIANDLSNGDVGTSKWVLDRLDPEYTQKKEITGADGEPLGGDNAKVIFIKEEDEQAALDHIASVIGEENM